MNEREKDLIDRRSELESCLDDASSESLFDAASRGATALEFRASDAMIGLDTVPDALVDLVEDLVIKSFGRAVDLGHDGARVRLADFLVDRDREEQALSVLLEGAKAGDRAAARGAAEIIWERQDETLAADAFEMASNAAESSGGHSDPRAEYVLGLFRFNAFGCERDHAKSAEHHRIAAEAGEADAMFELSVLLGQGLGVEIDREASLRWCRNAAEAEQSRAQYNMGAFYATGRGVDRDMDEAVGWYSRAAHNGHGRAAATLGIMYALGSGIGADDVKAGKFFGLAGSSGYDWETMADAVGIDAEAYR